MYLGAHLGIADGLGEAVRQAKTIGAESLQIFSKSPQMWAGPALASTSVEEFRASVRAEGLRATAVHHGYLANLASPKAETLARSRAAFRDELERAERLGVNALIFHPGAHLGSGPEAGLRTLAESLRAVIAERPNGTVRILLENAAGQGTALGSTFEELRTALDLVGAPDRVGVALDTCHLFAAGFDFRSPEGYGALVDRVASILGTGTVRAFHLNDAKAPAGSHLDRHENIGKGEIGTVGFAHFVNDRRWAEVPGYLETPLDDDGYARYRADLETLRSLVGSRASKSAREPRPAKTPRRASTVK